jgi:hypothetical protein
MTGMSDGPDVPAPPIAKASLKERLSALFNEYGRIAIITYFTLSILTIIGFSVAFGFGLAPSTATGVLEAIFAGWVAAKATLPIRILITLGLTPLVEWVVLRRRRTATAVPEDTPPDARPDPSPAAAAADVDPR